MGSRRKKRRRRAGWKRFLQARCKIKYESLTQPASGLEVSPGDSGVRELKK